MFRLGDLVDPGEGPTSLQPLLMLGAGVPAKLQAPSWEDSEKSVTQGRYWFPQPLLTLLDP